MAAGLYVRYRCSACKSERVTAYVTGRWSALEQNWESVSEVSDFACLNCESRDIKTLPLTGIELARAEEALPAVAIGLPASLLRYRQAVRGQRAESAGDPRGCR